MFRMAIPCCRRVIHQLLVATLILTGSKSLSWAAERAAPNPPGPFVEETEAWAMLFQMVSRLRTAVAKGELTLIICCVSHDVPRYSGISYEKK
jgi:hypothetical protein